MKYMLLIYSEFGEPQGTEEEQAAGMQRWFEYTNEMVEAGVHVAGDALLPTSTATTVRVRNDETLLTDGPFAETKEMLGGYYLMEVEDLDEATHWAVKCPASEYGSVELRPLMELPEG